MSAEEIEKFVFDSGKPGKTLAVFGAVHGNEKCGTKAIRKAVDEGLKPATGKVIYVPICNPRAYKEDVRFIDRNLNRHLYPKETHEAYEDSLDPVICGILDETDILLDLHSYESKGGPFIFLGQGGTEDEFAMSLGIKDFVCGWTEAFTKSSEIGAKSSIGTTEYIRNKGGMGITLECGHHYNEDAADIAYAAIKSALAYLENGASVEQHEVRIVKMKKVFYKEKEGKWPKPWQHYDEVKVGEVMARYEDGEEIIAEEDGFIVLPKAAPKLGGEWFYFGTSLEVPK